MHITRPVNFRDLGGTAAADGRTVAPRRILRAGELIGLSPAERRVLLEDYELRTIIDLRSTHERDQRPNDALPVDTRHIDVLASVSPKVGAADKEGLSHMRTAAVLCEQMSGLYRKLIAEEGARRQYRAFVDVFLTVEEGAVLFHCFAGKDRTGIGAAILLTLLGASEQDILADYLQSNVARAAENEALLRARMAEGPMDDAEIAAFQIAMGVREEFLAAALDEAQQRFGGLMGYCTVGLGVTDDEVAQLRTRYLSR